MSRNPDLLDIDPGEVSRPLCEHVEHGEPCLKPAMTRDETGLWLCREHAAAEGVPPLYKQRIGG
jgi:hypothetical protein